MTTSITAGKFCLDVTQTYIFSPASARIWKSHRVKHRNIQFLMILNQIFLHYITLHGPLYHLWNTTEVKHCPFPFLLVLTDNTEKATLQDRQKYRLEPGWFHEVNATKHFCSLSHVSTLPSGTCCSVSIFFAVVAASLKQDPQQDALFGSVLVLFPRSQLNPMRCKSHLTRCTVLNVSSCSELSWILHIWVRFSLQPLSQWLQPALDEGLNSWCHLGQPFQPMILPAAFHMNRSCKDFVLSLPLLSFTEPIRYCYIWENILNTNSLMKLGELRKEQTIE